jgi:hypothetical protein
VCSANGGKKPQLSWRVALSPGAKESEGPAIAKALGVPVCELFEKTGHERQRREQPARH